MGYTYDPAKQPGDPKYYAPGYPGTPTNVGPGGRTTNIENNEKGILESSLAQVAHDGSTPLKHDHAANRRGIYASDNSDG